MGGTRFSADDWAAHAASAKTKSTSQLFRATTIDKALDPVNIKVRESVDSPANPESTPIILFVDETGSMGELARIIIQKGLGIIMTEIYDRKPVTDPHILIGGIGDAFTDNFPLQPSQFEAGVQPLLDQIPKIVIEGNGGGNGGESYLMAWYFAALKTKTDAWDKRQKKGYLFTIGDEEPHQVLTKEQIKRFFGDDVEADMSARDLHDLACQRWEVFHLKVRPESRYRRAPWVELMGERVIDVTDTDKLAEVIVSTMQIIEGQDAQQVQSSWDGSTNIVVREATKGLVKRNDPSNGTGVVTL